MPDPIVDPSERTPRRAIRGRKRLEVFRKWGYRCAYCLRRPSGDDDNWLEVEHINPIACGGTNDFENLTCACAECNRAKGANPSFRPPHPPMAFEGDIEAEERIARRMEELSDRWLKIDEQFRDHANNVLAKWSREFHGRSVAPPDATKIIALFQREVEVMDALQAVRTTYEAYCKGKITTERWHAANYFLKVLRSIAEKKEAGGS